MDLKHGWRLIEWFPCVGFGNPRIHEQFFMDRWKHRGWGETLVSSWDERTCWNGLCSNANQFPLALFSLVFDLLHSQKCQALTKVPILVLKKFEGAYLKFNFRPQNRTSTSTVFSIFGWILTHDFVWFEICWWHCQKILVHIGLMCRWPPWVRNSVWNESRGEEFSLWSKPTIFVVLKKNNENPTGEKITSPLSGQKASLITCHIGFFCDFPTTLPS